MLRRSLISKSILAVCVCLAPACKRGGSWSVGTADLAAAPIVKPVPPSPARAAAGPASRASLGTNLDALADASSEWSLVDTFKASRAWISATEDKWDDGRPLDVDRNGWVRALKPGQIARTLMLWDGVPAPKGKYVVTYEGDGTLEYLFNVPVERGQGRDVVELDPKKSGLGIGIKATNPANPLRNLRVYFPGGTCAADPARACDEASPCAKGACVPFEKTAAAAPFHPTFLERIRRYGVLRFMDWMQTNNSKQRRWADRPQPTDARFSERGVPVEVMVALANHTGQDPWFCMPHLADDDYVERFAVYVRDHLKPGLRAYVEHSNEVWNDIFEQAAHARKRGVAEDLSDDENVARLRWHARRSAKIFAIWTKVFGGASRERVIRVLGAQASNTWATEQMLRFENTVASVDAVAIAPYFGGGFGDPENRARLRGLSVDAFLQELRDKAIPEAANATKEHAALVRKLNLDLIAYEGGQHLVAMGPAQDDDKVNALFDAANRHPRMKQLYLDYLGLWKSNGGGLFVHFVNASRWSKWGRWGALESLDQTRAQAPKYDALMTFVETTPKWW